MYAIGDLVHGPALAHKASDEGVIAVEDAAGLDTHPIEYLDIPRVTFCTPNVASFGLTEEQAREQGYDVTVGKVQYGAVGAGTVYGDRTGLIKIVGREEVRRAARRPHRRREGDRADPGARQRAAARGRISRGRAHHPRPPDPVRGGDGGGTGRRRMADPRLSAGRPRPTQPIFYYDLGSPRCYLLAERIMAALPVVPEWEPVLGTTIGLREPEPDREGLERIADEQGIQPLRWPRQLAAGRREAMLAATYAKHIGRAVAFSLACFRQAFAGGRDLGDENTVLIAAAACEMHPTAVLKGIGMRSVTESLARAGERASAAGVAPSAGDPGRRADLRRRRGGGARTEQREALR